MTRSERTLFWLGLFFVTAPIWTLLLDTLGLLAGLDPLNLAIVSGGFGAVLLGASQRGSYTRLLAAIGGGLLAVVIQVYGISLVLLALSDLQG